MKPTSIIIALGFAGAFGTDVSSELQKDIRQWILEMHASQIELLKIDWGQPGFCTEWDRDYSRVSGSCGRHRKHLKRQSSD